MKACLLFILLFTGVAAHSQESRLSGEVSVLNSKTWTGTRQYVAGAQVEVKYIKEQPTATNGNGQFKLVFVGVEESNSVHIAVSKPGLLVVNINALSAVAGQKDMVKISMASPDSIAEYQRRLFVSGKTQTEKKLEMLLNQKMAELQELKKNAARNVKRIAQIEIEAAEVQEKSKKVYELASNFAEEYYSVNLDDASPLFRTAFSLFEQGYLDSALALLKEIDLHKKVSEALKAGYRLDSLKKNYDSSITALKEWLQLTATLSKLHYEFDGAADCYQMLLQLDSTNVDYLVDYANFLDWLNRHDSAFVIYLRALEICKVKYAGDADAYNPAVARVQNNLGILYLDKNELDQAEAALLQALTIRKHIADTDSKKYDARIANTENNLGLLYLKKGDFARTKAAFLEALVIRQGLVKENQPANEPDLASTLNNIGVLYNSAKATSDSAPYFFTPALEIYNRLAARSSKGYEEEAARIYNNLGVWYFGRKQYQKADTALSQSVRLRKQLAQSNPQAFEPDVAVTQNNLGSLYIETKEYAKAEAALKEALAIRRKFALINSEVFDAGLAQTLSNLGTLWRSRNNSANAIACYQEALELRKKMAAKNPETIEPLIATILTYLGTLFYQTSQPVNSQASFEEAASIFRQLSAANPQLYEPDFAKALSNLGTVYAFRQEKDKAKNAYNEALQIYLHLALTNPALYANAAETIKARLENIEK